MDLLSSSGADNHVVGCRQVQNFVCTCFYYVQSEDFCDLFFHPNIFTLSHFIRKLGELAKFENALVRMRLDLKIWSVTFQIKVVVHSYDTNEQSGCHSLPQKTLLFEHCHILFEIVYKNPRFTIFTISRPWSW